jgi:hypothetical protein
MPLHEKNIHLVTFDFLSNCHSLFKIQNGKNKVDEFWSENKNNWGIRIRSATKRFKFEGWYIKISDIYNKKEPRKFMQTDRRESRQQENEANRAEEPLLGYARQARDRNLSLTRKIINIKAKELQKNWVMNHDSEINSQM